MEYGFMIHKNVQDYQNFLQGRYNKQHTVRMMVVSILWDSLHLHFPINGRDKKMFTVYLPLLIKRSPFGTFQCGRLIEVGR